MTAEALFEMFVEFFRGEVRDVAPKKIDDWVRRNRSRLMPNFELMAAALAARQAEATAQAAEERAIEAEERAQAAEVEAREAEERVQEAESRAAVAEAEVAAIADSEPAAFDEPTVEEDMTQEDANRILDDMFRAAMARMNAAIDRNPAISEDELLDAAFPEKAEGMLASRGWGHRYRNIARACMGEGMPVRPPSSIKAAYTDDELGDRINVALDEAQDSGADLKSDYAIVTFDELSGATRAATLRQALILAREAGWSAEIHDDRVMLREPAGEQREDAPRASPTPRGGPAPSCLPALNPLKLDGVEPPSRAPRGPHVETTSENSAPDAPSDVQHPSNDRQRQPTRSPHEARPSDGRANRWGGADPTTARSTATRATELYRYIPAGLISQSCPGLGRRRCVARGFTAGPRRGRSSRMGHVHGSCSAAAGGEPHQGPGASDPEGADEKPIQGHAGQHPLVALQPPMSQVQEALARETGPNEDIKGLIHAAYNFSQLPQAEWGKHSWAAGIVVGRLIDQAKPAAVQQAREELVKRWDAQLKAQACKPADSVVECGKKILTIIFDPWYWLRSDDGYPPVVRLVAESAMTNPDRPLASVLSGFAAVKEEDRPALTDSVRAFLNRAWEGAWVLLASSSSTRCGLVAAQKLQDGTWSGWWQDPWAAVLPTAQHDPPAHTLVMNQGKTKDGGLYDDPTDDTAWEKVKFYVDDSVRTWDPSILNTNPRLSLPSGQARRPNKLASSPRTRRRHSTATSSSLSPSALVLSSF
ncbi:hypothetical protein [Nannocystis pusilla]|uniref:hypothetical protein n=1 Tax=Nannocystis pusilla TaxID=889268 RepID=UPI003B7DF1EE